MKKLPIAGWVLYLFGFGFLVSALLKVVQDKVTQGGVVTVMALMCFAFANLTRFKRFKGLSFEAELWEDKQEEAEALIGKLKEVVTIYTAELVMSKVTEGRFADPNRWPKVWELHDKLVEQHDTLGQKIDFSDLKRRADTYFLFDMCMAHNHHQRAVFNAVSKANEAINKEFGSLITDNDGHNARMAQFREIDQKGPDAWTVAQSGNLADALLHWIEDSDVKFKKYFGFGLDLDAQEIVRLRRISQLWNSRPVPVNSETLGLTIRDRA